MKAIKGILVAVLIISGLIPLPVIFSALFAQDNAVAMLNLAGLTTDIEKTLLIAGAFMLSFVILFWVAAVWVMRENPAGYTLAFILGIITLLRGVLLFATFNMHHLPPVIIAIVATIDGALVIILTAIAKRK